MTYDPVKVFQRTLSNAELQEQPGGSVALIAPDRFAYSYLHSAIEAMGVKETQRQEVRDDGKLVLIYAEQDAPLLRRYHNQARENFPKQDQRQTSRGL